ncbi:MAG: DNA-binding protein [Actinobacteria bacterium]|nr:DNA-binding protein [Actinomycetota bacterium]
MPNNPGWLERLTKPPEATRSENLRKWAETIPGATPIAEAAEQHRHKVAGVIQNIRIDPRQGSGCIEATVIDGSGEILAKWLGRQSMSGIRLGVGLVMEGMVGVGLDEEKVILNPEYQLVPGPERS